MHFYLLPNHTNPISNGRRVLFRSPYSRTRTHHIKWTLVTHTHATIVTPGPLCWPSTHPKPWVWISHRCISTGQLHTSVVCASTSGLSTQSSTGHLKGNSS